MHAEVGMKQQSYGVQQHEVEGAHAKRIEEENFWQASCTQASERLSLKGWQTQER